MWNNTCLGSTDVGDIRRFWGEASDRRRRTEPPLTVTPVNRHGDDAEGSSCRADRSVRSRDQGSDVVDLEGDT